MKEKKKVILNVLKKHLDGHSDKFETQILEFALKKKESCRDDGWGVFYSKGGKRLVAARKTIEGDYTVKDDTQEICDNAFWGCVFLRKLALPASVVKIGDEAFARCISLESVCIPQSVEAIGKNPFVGLDAKVVDNQSTAFAIDGKMLYNAEHTCLISCMTDAAMVIVPKTVETIGGLAFCQRAKLKKVQLPEGLCRIEKDAFCDCDALEELTIPASVSTIEPYAFSGCDRLRKVVFLGTPNHISRTAFSDCDNLMSILVPEGEEKSFRKQLHLTSDSDTLVLANEKEKKAEPRSNTK